MIRLAQAVAKISLVVFSTLTALLVAEIASRYLYHVEIAHFVDCHGRRAEIRVDDPELEVRLKPKFCGELIGSEFRISIRTNGAGYRDNEFRKEKGDVYRIFGLGDSYTLGWGVELDQTYLRLLEKKLQCRLGRSVETYNLGVWSYGTLQEIKVFHLFQDYKPDLVILQFYARDAFVQEAGNDLVDNYDFNLWYETRDRPRGTNRELRDFENSPLTRFKGVIQHNCNLCRIAFLEFGGYFKKNFHPQGNEHLRQVAWQITEDALRGLDRDLAAMRIQGLLVWIPPPGTLQANDNAVFNKLSSFGFHNITVVNPLDALAASPAKYYYSLDTHLRPAGHELVADLAAQAILAKGLLKGSDK